MLGALAIVIAILIVLNAQDRRDQQNPAPTITNTITQTTPYQSPAALPAPRIDPPATGPGADYTARAAVCMATSASPWTPAPAAPRAPEQTAPMTTPQHLSDRYELGEILGFGGMSEVHLARDLRLHRDVAIKVLRADLARDPSFYLRFRREAQNAAALNHPAIVAVYDTGEAETPTGPLPYIVMEYVDGVTLRDIVHNEGPMPARRAIEVIADACQALNFSHQHGIIHRDVKPANIMISKTGAVKVMDFGIARALADASSVTQTAAVIGTAQYLSPEQARGERVDSRSDVYSLGCVLYEILTGEPPFVGDSPVAVAYQHVREDPVPPSQHDSGHLAGTGRRGAQGAGQEPRQPLPERRRDARGSGPGAQRRDSPRRPRCSPRPSAPRCWPPTGHGRGGHTDSLPAEHRIGTDPSAAARSAVG